jgi:hypothetical protein
MRNRFTLFALLAWGALLRAQVSDGTLPPSFRTDFMESAAADKALTLLPALDMERVRREDSETPGQNRFAAPIAVDIAPDGAGVWTELPDGSRLWRCALRAPGAAGLVLLFDALRLPEGGQLYVYSADRKWLRGGFTAESCTASGKFLLGVVPGETAWLECREPAAQRGRTQLHLNRVDYAYDRQALRSADPASFLGFGDAAPCHFNVNCAQGNNWQTEKRGIARILMVFSNGTGWCSGTTIANTAGTPEPYFLSANHCQLIGMNPDFSLWRFDFDYESPNCSDPATQPVPKSVLGCTRVAFRDETDFMLLRMSGLPANYTVHFNGWNRNANPGATSTTFIHHPIGDIKKISVDQQAPTVFGPGIDWGPGFGISPSNSHWRAIPDEGYFEPGSSGCPLFNQNKQIIGQLHGGNATLSNCTVQNTYWGRFDLSWDQGSTPQSRLRDWLDPNNTGASTQNPYTPQPATFSISGTVLTHWGLPLPGVDVLLSGSVNATATTNASGQYNFANIPAGSNVTLSPQRDLGDIEGVTTFDLVLVSKHILTVDTLDSPWKIIAADANRSNSVTTFDIVESRKVILGINPAYPLNTAWRFFPASTVFADPLNPFLGGLPAEQLVFSNVQANIATANFLGVKVGDVNNSFAP